LAFFFASGQSRGVPKALYNAPNQQWSLYLFVCAAFSGSGNKLTEDPFCPTYSALMTESPLSAYDVITDRLRVIDGSLLVRKLVWADINESCGAGMLQHPADEKYKAFPSTADVAPSAILLQMNMPGQLRIRCPLRVKAGCGK
jgi:hypothetical protein